jgi:hypothetical protein
VGFGTYCLVAVVHRRPESEILHEMAEAEQLALEQQVLVEEAVPVAVR